MNKGIFLAACIGLTCSAIFFLPPFRQSQSAMNLEIPPRIGSWNAETFAASQKEIKTLAADTTFAKAVCTRPRSEEMSYIYGTSPTDQVDLSIVLSGYDLSNSIHRPERCMPAQGHRGLLASKSKIDLDNGRTLPLTKILSKRDITFVDEQEKKHHLTFNYLTYYFFVGHEEVTEDHTHRTLIDIVDRVAKGEAQRWAFVMVSMPYQDEAPHEYGAPLLTEELADKKIRQILAELAEKNIDWERIRS